jgi:TonB family protein
MRSLGDPVRKTMALFLLVLGLFLLPGQAQTREPIVICVQLFQGIREEGREGLKAIEIIPAASRPELASFKAGLGGSEAARTAAAFEALLEIFGLRAVDELFLHEAGWNGKDVPIDGWIFGKSISYRVGLRPKKNSPQQIALHVAVDKKKTTDRTTMAGGAETIVAQDLILDLGEPIVVGLPNPAGDYFMVAWAAVGTPRVKPYIANETIYYVTPPKSRSQVQPYFPEELRRRNLRGRIGLLIKIDEKGNVRHVDVEKPLHAYLNYSAVQAFLRWTFEPVQIKEKPVKAAFRFEYDFNPWLYMQEETWAVNPPPGASVPDRGDLGRVLDLGAAYCQKLASVASDYVCEESIQETHYDPLNNRRWVVLKVGPSDRRDKRENPLEVQEDPEFIDRINKGVIADDHRVVGRLAYEQWFQYVDPKRDKRNIYLCDYQIFRKDNTVQEHRNILKENGKKPADSNKILQDRRYSALGSLFAPLKILAKNRQLKFDYWVTGEEKINGKKARILTASPKSGDEDGIWWARIWVDKENFQVLKCEIEGVPIDGHEDILNECASLNIRPHFLMTYEYKTEKNGALFPWRSEILVAYSGIDAGGPVPRLKIFMNYDKYKFFGVATESKVIR